MKSLCVHVYVIAIHINITGNLALILSARLINLKLVYMSQLKHKFKCKSSYSSVSKNGPDIGARMSFVYSCFGKGCPKEG